MIALYTVNATCVCVYNEAQSYNFVESFINSAQMKWSIKHYSRLLISIKFYAIITGFCCCFWPCANFKLHGETQVKAFRSDWSLLSLVIIFIQNVSLHEKNLWFYIKLHARTLYNIITIYYYVIFESISFSTFIWSMNMQLAVCSHTKTTTGQYLNC